MRYYIQLIGDAPSLRRYDTNTRERWDSGQQKWTGDCTPEESCRLTKDREVTEKEAQKQFGCSI